MASGVGVIVLIVGLTIALLLGLIPTALGYGLLGLALGAPVALFALSLGVLLLLGGRNLRKLGTDASQRTREQGIFALATHRGGILRAGDVAQALGIPVDEADAELTTLAKQKSDQVSLELDEDGGIFYRFMNVPGAFAWPGRTGVRVASETGPLARPRVEAPSVEQQPQEELDDLEAPLPPVQGQARRRPAPG